jgi:hypothetical protein
VHSYFVLNHFETIQKDTNIGSLTTSLVQSPYPSCLCHAVCVCVCLSVLVVNACDQAGGNLRLLKLNRFLQQFCNEEQHQHTHTQANKSEAYVFHKRQTGQLKWSMATPGNNACHKNESHLTSWLE